MMTEVHDDNVNIMPTLRRGRNVVVLIIAEKVSARGEEVRRCRCHEGQRAKA